MKIDRSLDSALEAIMTSAKEKTNNTNEQNLSKNLLKIGFENQFQKGETTKIKNLINDSIDEFIQNID
jgi:hypothetical protein